MVELNSSFIDWLERTSNTSASPDIQSTNQTSIILIILGIFAVILIITLLVSYRVYKELCRKRKQKNGQQSLQSRDTASMYHVSIRSNTITESARVSSLFAIPVLRGTLSDSRGVSSIYPVHVRSDTISCVEQDEEEEEQEEEEEEEEEYDDDIDEEEEEESPPCHQSVIPLQERQSEPPVRL